MCVGISGRRPMGLQKGLTKPDRRKHRVNDGPAPQIFAAIIGCKVRVWHYLPRRWTGAATTKVYHDISAPALKRRHGEKSRCNILEDYDPAGYEAAPAVDAKTALKIRPVALPTYSPDINPCDTLCGTRYSAGWTVCPRLRARRSLSSKKRPHKVALTIPKGTVRKLVASMKARTQDVYERKGGRIPRD